ncbi:methyltransferase family protein [Brevibacterium sanguinis]|uniref:Methyltransferase family protein n=2 Tax=Brevibacterium TaxID=1696 RepID=A0A366IHW1_9MICO|nr:MULTISPECIES: methyltransferase [Brevibacterium]RBP64944.1 methyltransferase family protein [Brevibacterium sanguinis]RBP71207.1 methyltransferase family protein [Brevibacterium celere]
MREARRAGAEAADCGPKLDPLVDAARDRAALASMAWAVDRLGGDSPAAATMAADLSADARAIVGRWLDELRRSGHLSADIRWVSAPPSRAEVDRAWAEALALAPDPGAGGALTRFFAACSRNLPALLTGEVRLQSLLFDQDDIAAEIYRTNEASRYTNAAAAEVVRARCRGVLRSGRTPQVLEVGGGVGGTTEAVLDTVRDLPLRYHFTDVGDWFVTRACTHWAGRAGLSAGILDINDASERQREALGDLAGGIDVVLAANVMHNAVDVSSSLRILADLCRPEAALALIETGTEHLPLLISMRFLMTLPPPGSGIGGDRTRTGRTLLDTTDWSEVVAASGWDLLDVLPGPDDDHPAARYDQHVWHAVRAPKETDR